MSSGKNERCIVHTDWSRAYGGQEIRTLTELREMKKLGFSTGLIVPEESVLAQRGREEGIPVYPVAFRSKFDLRSWLALFRIIRQIRPDVLNTHSSEDSWMAGCVAKLCGVPLIARTRHVQAPISSALSYNAFPQVIFACSKAIRDQLIEQGVQASKIIVQSTGIDEQRFQFSAEDRREIRQKYAIADDDVLVGNVAFLRHYKGHAFIVKTAEIMPEKYKFILVGEGDERKRLQAMVDAAGIADRFIFAGHQEQPERYFSAFDIMFFSSYESEGVAQSFIQGLLYGLPVLLCRTPSLLEPLEFVPHYCLVDYDDCEAARAGLLDLSDHARDEQAIALQRQKIAGRYGLKNMIKTILEVYARFGIHR